MTFSKQFKAKFFKKYGNWALVTGASSGIGEAIALQLAALGFNVVINSRDEEKLNQLAEHLELKYKVNARVAVADISNVQGVNTLIEDTTSVDIRLAVLSAGFGTSGLFIDSDLDTEINMLHLNCESLLRLTHHFVKLFADYGRGGLILMSSIVGFQGAPNASNYAATKGYVQLLAEGLYHELKPFNVDVIASAPGPVNTGFGKRANMNMKQTLKPSEVATSTLKALGKTSTVFPGFLTKFLVFGLRLVPRFLKIRIMKKVMGDMTKHHYTQE